ncbi:MAG: sirohydrochlorin cobaltochelatase [Clostridium sp.]|nr:sirohydrochlorin cobaltochelatase [Clostridium sp.]
MSEGKPPCFWHGGFLAIGRDIIFLHLIVISLIQCYYYLYTYLKQNETEDTSLENTRNQDGIGAWELLAASFGTSYQDTRCRTIGAIEEDLEQAFPEYSVRRGFTSRMIINRVKTRDQIAIDSLEEALRRAADNGVKRLIVQPTHMMDGFEYTALADKVAEYSRFFEAAAVGKPLLSSEGDFQAVVQALIEETEEYDDKETAFCFMGHGTEAQANHVYRKLQEMFLAAGHENYFIGTVEAEPALEEVLAQVKKGSYKRAVLQPLMIVAGDHANNDMAGDEEGSWKRAFEEAGYEVSCILKGLGELEKIRRIFVRHAKEAESSLSEA